MSIECMLAEVAGTMRKHLAPVVNMTYSVRGTQEEIQLNLTNADAGLVIII